jgi:hypothetical protein
MGSEKLTPAQEAIVHNHLPRSRTPVDDTSRLRRNKTVGVDVSHDIVASTLLLESSSRELIVLDALVLLQLSNGLLRDVETELALGLSKVDPKLSPGAEAVARREDVLHLLRGVPRVEGAEAWVSIALARDESSAIGGAMAVRDVLVMSGSGTNVLRICVQICRHVDVWCSYHLVNRWFGREKML